MKMYGRLSLLLVMVLSGCTTNYMYQGRFSAKDAYGKERHFLIYWPKTELLLGETKAGPAIMLTECNQTAIDFSDQSQNEIVFRGEQGSDRLIKGKTPDNGESFNCGRILKYAKFVDIPTGPIELSITCEPVSNEFAIKPRDYPKARTEPYLVPVYISEKKRSIFGQTLPGPKLDCPTNQ